MPAPIRVTVELTMKKQSLLPGSSVSLGLLLLAGLLWVAGRCGSDQAAAPARIATAVPVATLARAAAMPVAAPTSVVSAPTSQPMPRASLTAAQSDRQGTVTATVLNVRQGPGASYPIAGQTRQGVRVTLLDQSGEWLKVVTPARIIGWVAAQYVRLDAAPTPATAVIAAVATSAVPAGAQEARVTEVVDGDTIKVLLNDQVYSVRYIGMNTPEMSAPDGPTAKAANARLAEGQTVRLEKDVSETDRYGRLLRYVWVGDVMVNAELVRLGYAQAASYPPDVKHQAEFSRLQREAAAAGRGLWVSAVTANAGANLRGGPGKNYPIVGQAKAGEALSLTARTAKSDWYQLASGTWIAASLVANAPAGLPVAAVIPTPPAAKATPTRASAVRAPAAPAQQCDSCYPGVCIPAVTYDLDCPDIPFCQFQVTCDPHRFDGDHDGIGCEVCR
jgi:micrococcal nuclease